MHYAIKIELAVLLSVFIFLSPAAVQTQVPSKLAAPSWLSSLTPPPPRETSPSNIDPALFQALSSKGSTDFWIIFQEAADLSPAYTMTWEERGEFVYNTLRVTAEQSQTEARRCLEQTGLHYTSHWIVNAIYVRGGNTTTLHALSALKNVRLRAPRMLHLAEPTSTHRNAYLSASPTVPPLNLILIQADAVWDNYTRGEGIVVANIDTGVRYTHEALASQYRGNLGTGSYDHNYNWYDPDGSPVPYDENSHGTHTMGTMVGHNPLDGPIGVAPGATWIAADGCNGSNCSDEDLISSGEWLLAPCPIGIAPGDPACRPDLRPHVVNNSWGDCETVTIDLFHEVIMAWHAAGIFSVFANCNTINCYYDAAYCGSVCNPARHYLVTSVGATDYLGEIAHFSLWGPTDNPDPRDPDFGAIKPEIVAPGVEIWSAVSSTDNAYGHKSGTSMAAPHVAGVAALVLSANQGLIGQTDTLKGILKQTADPRARDTACGNEGPGQIPNNAYGWGRVNAYSAVEAALTTPQLMVTKTAAYTQVMAGDPLTYTFTVTNHHGVGTGITVRDILPPHTSYGGSSDGGELSGNEVRWKGFALEHGNDLTITLTLTAQCAAINTTVINTAFQVTATEWTTPIYGSPVSVTILTPTVVADFLPPPYPLRSIPTRFTNLSQRAKAASWDFGDGTVSNDNDPYHIYNESGHYTVTLTATGYCGREATRTYPITVQEGLFFPLLFK